MELRATTKNELGKVISIKPLIAIEGFNEFFFVLVTLIVGLLVGENPYEGLFG